MTMSHTSSECATRALSQHEVIDIRIPLVEHIRWLCCEGELIPVARARARHQSHVG